MSFLDSIKHIATWRRRGERAPHKPLLLLLALGDWARGRETLPFVECTDRLGDLIREFGPPRRVVHPEYPFWRLQRDGLWQVVTAGSLRRRRGNSDPTRASLIASHAKGMFPDRIATELREYPERVNVAARILLDSYFPSTVHEDVASAVGLCVDAPISGMRVNRDPAFRAKILNAYEFRCAVCGYGVRMQHTSVGLEAAHIRWHQYGGPDITENGIALCALHHKLFDLGAFTLCENLNVLVSDAVTGSEDLASVLLRHHTRRISCTIHPEDRPANAYLSWHRREVFKGRARPAAP